MKLRYKLISLGGVLLSVFLLGRCGRNTPKSSPVLPSNDKEQILVDPYKHKLIIVKPNGTTVTTLPDRESTIDILKDGSVKITAKQFGFEAKPFIGFNISDRARFCAGSDMFYFKRWDAGLGLGIQKDFGSFVGFGKISYNIWSNISLGGTFDNQKHIGMLLSVRL